MGFHGEMAQRCFATELALIKDQRVRDFVIQCFDTVCPSYFWERAASSSGKYHPSFVTGKGGLVRHVKFACYWGRQFCRPLDGSGYESDEMSTPNQDFVLAALIMHDMMKDGDPALAEKKRSYDETISCHGVDLAEAIWTRVLKGKAESWQTLILYAVAAHMSVWTCGKGNKFPKYAKWMPSNLENPLVRRVAWIVALSDYAASRKTEDVIPGITAFQVA